MHIAELITTLTPDAYDLPDHLAAVNLLKFTIHFSFHLNLMLNISCNVDI